MGMWNSHWNVQHVNMPTYNLLETIHDIWLQQSEKRCMLVCYDLIYMIMCKLSSNLHYIVPSYMVVVLGLVQTWMNNNCVK
jgi:hypothetical protein